MNVLFISIDSLNRHFLEAYGQSVELAVAAPNLERFAAKAATFERHYAGSLPCMPARREFFCGVQEFLWRPWGPVEPFDAPLPRLARGAGATTQLVTDHFHYFQHGSYGYVEDYHGFEFVRGHEYNAWKTAPREPDKTLLEQIKADDPTGLGFMNRAAYARNVAGFTQEEDFFAAKVFRAASSWLRENTAHPEAHPKWFLAVDSFDVHEPFHLPEPYASMYTDEDPTDPELVNWPFYGRVGEGQSELSERQVAFVRAQYAGKLTMVDRWFGELLDALDGQGLWDNTMVVVTTDHGHYLGEGDWMGKPDAPLYNVLAHTPLFIWHPGSPLMGERVGALTAAVDLYATMLEGLGATVPPHVHSRSLLPLLKGESEHHRDWAMYGYWGSTVNVTDGRYTYLHPCRPDVDIHCYSTMMLNPYGWFLPPKVQHGATSGRFLPYTDAPVWRYPAPSLSRHNAPLLFDVRDDPAQMRNLAGQGLEVEARMKRLLLEALGELRAPPESYARWGLGSMQTP